MSAKSGGKEGGGQVPQPQQVQQQTHQHQGQITMTPAVGRDSEQSQPCKMRSFAEIMNEEKLHRNILEVKLIRTSVKNNNGETVKAPTLNETDLSEFFFDVIKLKIEDCLGIALRTHRYDTKEIKLKRGVDPSPYLTLTPHLFKGHEITIKKQMNNLTRVTLKNVPFNIPDEEIIHLCKVYGEPINNKVHYENPTRLSRGVPGSTRSVEMKITPGMQFENYYWMEGPLSDDQGCRITVLHAGQVQQCSHCLRRAMFCPGGGNGRACETLKTPRGKLNEYMKYLKERHNYTSLKMQYTEEQFPALGGNTEGGFGNIVENTDPDDEVSEDMANNGELLSDLNALKEQLTQAKAQIKVEQNISARAARKLEHVEKVASQRIVESMPGANFEEDSNHLAMLLATVLKNDDFEYDSLNDQVEPKTSSDFLKRIEEHCGDIPDKEAKLTIVRNKVLEKMKRTVRRERRLSGSGSICSGSSLFGSRAGSRTRQRSEGDELDGELAAKQSKASEFRKSRLPGPASLQTQ